MLNLSCPVILSAAKNLAIVAYNKQNSRFFASLKMTGEEVFSINK